MVASKEEGGMGFRDFGAFNEALLTKQAWRILMNLNLYWARMIYKGNLFSQFVLPSSYEGEKNHLRHGQVYLREERFLCKGWEGRWVTVIA